MTAKVDKDSRKSRFLMHRHARQIAAAVGLHARRSGFSSWRYAATLLLILFSMPIFLGAALLANVVAVPMLVLILVGETVQNLCAGDSARRRPRPH